jgi:hypothetical protein
LVFRKESNAEQPEICCGNFKGGTAFMDKTPLIMKAADDAILGLDAMPICGLVWPGAALTAFPGLPRLCARSYRSVKKNLYTYSYR